MEEKRTKRVPKCGYCTNHGIKNPLRAHKRDCKFLNCECKLCENTRARREHMADMQYIKRNGIVEMERLQSERDAKAAEKDVYAKIFQERMENKNKKRMMKDLKGGNVTTQEALLLADTTGSSSAVSPTSSIDRTILPSQLASLANFRAFAGTNPMVVNNLAAAAASSSSSIDLPNLEAQALANHLHKTPNRAPYTGLFSNVANVDNSSIFPNDHLLKAAKLLGIGLNSPPSPVSHSLTTSPNIPGVNLTQTTAASLSSFDRLNSSSTVRNEDVDLNEINEFVDRLSIVKGLNTDEKMLNAAICVLFNGLPLTLLNPSSVAEEIYSTFKQLNSTNLLR